MTSSDFTRFVFVDFENVPSVDLELVAGKPVHVTVLIGMKQTKLESAFVEQALRLPRQVQLVWMKAVGANVLDLTLAEHLCRTAARSLDSDFFIVAKDTGYDSLVTHLKKQGIKASRHNAFAELPFLSAPEKKSPAKLPFPGKPVAPAKSASRTKTPAPAKPKPPIDKYAKLIEQLKAGRNRPQKRAGLMRHINNLYGKHLSIEEQAATIARLVAAKVVTIDEKDKVTYL